MLTTRLLLTDNGHRMYTLRNDSKRLEMLAYIELIASRSNVDIATWDMNTFLGKDHNGIINLYSKTEINKKFAAELEKRGPDKLSARSLKYYENKIAQDLQAIYFSSTVDSLERVKIEQVEHIKDLNRKLSERMSIFTKMHLAQNAKHNISSNLTTQIKELLDTNHFYEFEKSEGKTLLFKTKDVVIAYNNPKSGEHYTVNFGNYIIYFYLQSFELKVYPTGSTLKYGDHYHPHVDSGGWPCWGTIIDSIDETILNANIVGLFGKLEFLLKSYFPSSPYVSIDKFHGEAIRKIKPEQAVERHLQQLQDLQNAAYPTQEQDIDRRSRQLEQVVAQANPGFEYRVRYQPIIREWVLPDIPDELVEAPDMPEALIDLAGDVANEPQT